MTKEEAINILWVEKRLCPDGGYGEARGFVDKLEALGLIKLDCPKTIDQRVSEAYGPYVSLSPAYLKQRLDEAGLKIVEK